MIKVAILGSGNIGQALAAFLGSRPEIQVVLWGRRWTGPVELCLSAHGPSATYAIGMAVADPILRRVIDGADVAIVTVPTHIRHRVLALGADRLNNCSLLIAWEGTGRFRESLHELGIVRPIAIGLQRSPILCRVRRPGRAVEIHGIRSEVVVAATDSTAASRAKRLLGWLLPFGIVFAPTYLCVSISPSNQLIHPARLYSFNRSGADRLRPGVGFYAEWDDAASDVLLSLHAEVARLRDALHLPAKFLQTLVDRRNPHSASDVTREIRAEKSLAKISFPLRARTSGFTLDLGHRFFREDVGEGLAYVLGIAQQAGVNMPTAGAIHTWYQHLTQVRAASFRSDDVPDHDLW